MARKRQRQSSQERPRKTKMFASFQCVPRLCYPRTAVPPPPPLRDVGHPDHRPHTVPPGRTAKTGLDGWENLDSHKLRPLFPSTRRAANRRSHLLSGRVPEWLMGMTRNHMASASQVRILSLSILFLPCRAIFLFGWILSRFSFFFLRQRRNNSLPGSVEN